MLSIAKFKVHYSFFFYPIFSDDVFVMMSCMARCYVYTHVRFPRVREIYYYRVKSVTVKYGITGLPTNLGSNDIEIGIK